MTSEPGEKLRRRPSGRTSRTGSAAGNRTAPLWGVRLRPRLMHDGASLTFLKAIGRHRGEASHVTLQFKRLKSSDQEAIIEFLKSL